MSVGQLYLLTWNLRWQPIAHDLALQHLAKQGTSGLFVACLQEIPATSSIGEARRAGATHPLGVNVVQTERLVRGLAIVHHPALEPLRVERDADEEFLAVVFRERGSRTAVGVVGLHAKSQINMHPAEGRGGSRALLRHAIGTLQLDCNHLIVLGDWNSAACSREVQSWHGFYALCPASKPLTAPAQKTRRGLEHPPLSVVMPRNPGLGTFDY